LNQNVFGSNINRRKEFEMKKWLSIMTAACLLLNPFAAFAADYGSQTSQTQQVPPVAQPLVREGDFAIKLAAELDLGNPTDEAIAEKMLTEAGVVPSNGWLSDYPVTPEIVGQLQSSIAKAASEGKLPMTADEATRGLYSLTRQMSLPTPAGSENELSPGSSQPPAVQSNPTVINNYYSEEGPPIVTYYPPPYYYAYLYNWVPYPVFWFGFWFPGFYICHSFTTVVVTRVGDFDHGHGGRHGIVSNRVIDPITRRVARVDPITRTDTGGVRPMTMLRAENGVSFRTVSDMRRGYAAPGMTGARAGTTSIGSSRTGGFRTPESRRSAEIIYSRSLEKLNMSGRQASSMVRGGDRHFISPNSWARSFNAPSRGVERPFGESRGNEWRSFSPSPRSERLFRAPSQGGGWQRSAAPSGPSRSFSAPVIRGDEGWSRSSSGNGWFDRGGALGRGFRAR
jgi:hypothetical protein